MSKKQANLMSKKQAKAKPGSGSRGVGRPATHPEGITRIVSATLPSEQVTSQRP